jgi:hypothetical protein
MNSKYFYIALLLLSNQRVINITDLICEQCGEPNEATKSYCERCGSHLSSSSSVFDPFSQKLSQKPDRNASKSTPDSSDQSVFQTENKLSSKDVSLSSLLDRQQLIYLFPYRRTLGSTQDIFNQQNHLIGKINLKSNSIRKIISFQELNGTLAFSLDFRPIKIPFSYDIIIENKEIIGKITKNFTLFRPSQYSLINERGILEFITQGNPKNHDYTICLENNPLMPIAIIKKGENMIGWPIQNVKNLQSIFGLRIIDPNVDRRKILAMIIAIKDSTR